MIVVDTNIIACVFIESSRTPLARRVWSLDPDWCLPELWRHEYLNILTTYVQHGGVTLDGARALWNGANKLLAGCVRPVDMVLALQLATAHKISAYDAQFIALAQRLNVLCVTEDRRLRAAFPRLTRSIEDFCSA